MNEKWIMVIVTSVMALAVIVSVIFSIGKTFQIQEIHTNEITELKGELFYMKELFIQSHDELEQDIKILNEKVSRVEVEVEWLRRTLVYEGESLSGTANSYTAPSGG